MERMRCQVGDGSKESRRQDGRTGGGDGTGMWCDDDVLLIAP